MADQKITALTELTTVAGGDLLPIVDDPGGSPVTKKITRDNLLKGSGLVVLLHNDEADSSEHASSAAESAALKTYTLPANSYAKVLVEFIVRSRNDADLAADPTYTWRIKFGGATARTFVDTAIGVTTTGVDGGDTHVSTISFVATTWTAGGDITITVQCSDSNAAMGGLVHAVRVYGVL